MRPFRLLHVEDDRLDREVSVGMLEGSGYVIETAESGEQGLELLERSPTDLVISDMTLPGMTGAEMIRRAAALDPTVVSIITSARDDREAVVRALDGGAHSFLLKPFSRAQLRESIEKALEERKRIVETHLLIGDLIRYAAELDRTRGRAGPNAYANRAFSFPSARRGIFRRPVDGSAGKRSDDQRRR